MSTLTAQDYIDLKKSLFMISYIGLITKSSHMGPFYALRSKALRAGVKAKTFYRLESEAHDKAYIAVTAIKKL